MRLMKGLIGVGMALLLAAGAYAQTFYYETIPSATSLDVGGGNTLLIKGSPNNPASSGTGLLLYNIALGNQPAGPFTFTDVPLGITFNLMSGPPSSSPTVLKSIPINYKLNGTLDTNLVVMPTASQTQTGLPTTFDYGGTTFDLTPGTFTQPNPYNPAVPPSDPTFVWGAASANVATSAIPEPGSLALLGVGLLPMLGLVRRRR